MAYAETLYNGASLGQNRRPRRGRVEWFEGRHEAIVSDELFERCQAARESLVVSRKPRAKRRTYILADRVYCGHCLARGDGNLSDANYGKMRIQWQRAKKAAIYRCIARDRGYGDCTQGIIYEKPVLDKVVEMLSGLGLPGDFQERIDALVKARPSNQEGLDLLADLHEQQRRVQFSWEHGKLLPEEYLVRTSQLEREIASIRPLDYDKLEEATDLLIHFGEYWDQCAEVTEPLEARQQLMAGIVDRVFVYDEDVIAVALYPDFGVILDVPAAAPQHLIAAVSENANGYNSEELYPVRGRRALHAHWARSFGRRLRREFITS